MTAHVERLEFQAEARQLLILLVHSVCSTKDSFLRELVSNASDALDKLRLEAFPNKDLDVDASDLHIEIEVGTHPRTLRIRDNGIGMTREEVVDLIGTLAKSGTAKLRQKLREAKNAGASEELIVSSVSASTRASWSPTRSSYSPSRPAKALPPVGFPAGRAPTPSSPSTTPRRELLSR
ncbi:MAG: molecular chaperone HtpG [Mycobacterium sp.]|nr:molecular chaperone HtpG [Mycobacterium sp.]